MKFTLVIADDIAAAILAHHGQSDAEDPADAMRVLVEFTLSAEARNAAKSAAMKSAEFLIEAGLDSELDGKFTVTKEVE